VSQEWDFESTAPPIAPPEIDTTVPHSARRYDYWLGGKDNFAVDRASGDAIAAAFPGIRIAAVENRGFLRRAVTFLAREAGIRQFLDIGTGLPTSPNVHEIAQEIEPASRVVYVDNDPIVLVHARALLSSAPRGATAYIDADLRHGEQILEQPDLRATLDLTRPTALLLLGIMHFFDDGDDAYGMVRRLTDSLSPGSYLALSQATGDYHSAATRAAVDEAFVKSRIPMRLRTREEFSRFFDGMEFVPPGIDLTSEWRAESEPRPRPAAEEVSAFAGVARIG
jgi:hypothetical protein